MTTTSVPASFTTAAQPFNLTNGGTLSLLFNSVNELVEPTYVPIPGGDTVVVTFIAREFGNIAAATAQEVADVINAAALAQRAAGTAEAAGVATVNDDNEVVVTSSTALASNGGSGQIIQVLPQSTELAALGLTAGLFYPVPYPAFDPPISL